MSEEVEAFARGGKKVRGFTDVDTFFLCKKRKLNWLMLNSLGISVNVCSKVITEKEGFHRDPEKNGGQFAVVLGENEGNSS